MSHQPLALPDPILSAYGRVVVEMRDESGSEEVTYERRLRDTAAARSWCEAKVRELGGQRVREIQVFEESWHTSGAWEAAPPRPYRDTLQVGATTGDDVIWASTYPIGPGNRVRRLF